MAEWFETFFDALYYETYSASENEERNEREAGFIAQALRLLPGARILDLACGYARHAVYLARRGFRVVCLDLSGFLLEKARERVRAFGVDGGVDIVRGDMRLLSYRSCFDGAYLFFTSFGYFSDEENRLVLEGVSEALRPGGVFLVDLWNPVALMHYAYTYDGLRRTWYEAGDYLVLEEVAYDVLGGRVDAKRRFLDRASGRVVGERRFTVRFYTYWEMRRLMEEAGLIVERAYGSYRGDEYRPSSPRMILVARKAQG